MSVIGENRAAGKNLRSASESVVWQKVTSIKKGFGLYYLSRFSINKFEHFSVLIINLFSLTKIIAEFFFL